MKGLIFVCRQSAADLDEITIHFQTTFTKLIEAEDPAKDKRQVDVEEVKISMINEKPFGPHTTAKGVGALSKT